MKILASRLFWGMLLIAGGLIFLSQNLLNFELSDVFWGSAMGIVGLAFLSLVIGDRRKWWALIPGLILLVLAVVTLFPSLIGMWTDTLLLGGIGLAFWVVYLLNLRNWWAIIPGGVLVTLAVVTALPDFGVLSRAIFFFGLGITFTLVGVLPNGQGRMSWAFIAALILMLVGLLTLGFVVEIIKYLGPLALIMLGLWLILRSLRR